MFDQAAAKSIGRDEILSTTSRLPSPVDESELQDARARLGKLFDLDGLYNINADGNETQETVPLAEAEDEDGEQEFEFRLFSAPTKSKESAEQIVDKKKVDQTTNDNEVTQKLRIRLRSPSPLNPSEGRFIKPFRGWQYYFSNPTLYEMKEPTYQALQAKRIQEFEDMAVTGEDIMAWASQAWPRCERPWRVTHLKRHQTKLPSKVPVYVVEGALPTKSPKTRKKPGKKRRLQLRKRVAVAQKAKESEAEKRKRQNRERQLKRRQKARDQKAAAAAGGDTSMVDTEA
ncbi:hypothetical protein N7495_004111 [Penicillium taxi]|uniref:uncharacterized protein n=1 Tax=Penicillium taxi TaxID=168475 RepID=UPI0025454AD5|nr:uncharacterized protein N7495_004111 [Penicillium taxi]KAJ5899367.1 hypothetical protein N7495_004111 [Penicillium taxi]